jgi:hypothetical protein
MRNRSVTTYLTRKSNYSKRNIPPYTLPIINSTDCTVLNMGLYDEKSAFHQTMAYSSIENTTFYKL